jgi:CRISPR-associated protein Cmr4
VREPGTGLPKIPGTSLSGAARQYAAYRYEKPQCAGQGQSSDAGDEGESEQKGHCRDRECPICYTFGYMTGPEGGHAGTVSIADARLLLFPVHSMAGPVWVTTVERLQEAGFTVDGASPSNDTAVTTLADWSANTNKPLNLGWLLLDIAGSAEVTPPSGALDAEKQSIWKTIAGRIVLVGRKLFGQIVNSNLEVRTSVSIDPQTGAAADKALFTYEAIPRATWMWLDVVEDDYRNGRKPWPVSKTFDKQKDLGETWNAPLDVMRAGLRLTEHLGVGGMGTRGFGRVKLVGDWEVDRG